MIRDLFNRRQFLKTGTLAITASALPRPALSSAKQSVLVFTKSSGWEHDVVKRIGGAPSVVDRAVTSLGNKQGFEVTSSKDGRIFDSSDLRKYAAVLFYTTGDLTTPGTDKNPPMSVQGKQTLLEAIHDGMGFIGIHPASDTFHTQPDPADGSNRYVAHGEKSDPYLRMVGGEFITHSNQPRMQSANLIVNDPNFPGLQGVASPVKFTDEWYSLKDFAPDMHVILTIDTKGMIGKPYQRSPYPVTWARMEDKGRVFYTAMGHGEEQWANPFFLKVLGGGIRWAIGDASGSVARNLSQAAPGYAVIPPKSND